MYAGDLVQTHVGSTIVALVSVNSYKDYNTYYFLLFFYTICVYNHKGRLIIGTNIILVSIFQVAFLCYHKII